MILDLRDDQPNPPPLYGSKNKHARERDGRSVIVRDLREIYAIVLHQTACRFGAPQGKSRHLRALGVACHALAFDDGVIALPNPLLWQVNHANGLNAISLGLEIEGWFPGETDKPTDRRQREPSPLVIETALEAVRVLVSEASKEGITISHVFAHRQSSPTRRADPGETIWREVARKCGLETDCRATWLTKEGRGRPIPRSWDPNGYGDY